MSIMVVQLTPQGVLFAADRNVTATITTVGRGVVHITKGQSQRPKVLKWPNQEAIIGYVGAASINGVPTDQWLYHSVIGEYLSFNGFEEVAKSLTSKLNGEIAASRISNELIIHLAGFEKVAGEWTPVIWFIRNTTGLTSSGGYAMGNKFDCSEEIADPRYFGGRSGNQIRQQVGSQFFSFRQGCDLAVFNTIDEALRAAMQAIVTGQRHPTPSTVEEWAKHLKMAVLGYSAYFQAFYESYEQFVGGGVDVVWAKWPTT